MNTAATASSLPAATSSSTDTSFGAPLDGASPLTHWGVIRARGVDSASFLHNQLTNDFMNLGPAQARLAGYCSPKGRLMASFVGWQDGEDILLACSADLLAPTLKRLSMFVLRSKTKLTDASAEVRLIGLAGPSAADWLGADAPAHPWAVASHKGAVVVRLPDAAGMQRYIWSCADPAVAVPPLPVLPLDQWRWLEVQSGVPTIEAATVEKFVPQMINFELVGGVNFQKGCYPGQEIVARAQYRGTVKRRLFLFDVEAGTDAVSPVAGAEIFSSDDPGQPAGTVANVAHRVDGGVSLLAELKLSASEGQALHVGAVDGPALSKMALPYELPMDADTAGG
ncbi:MAG: folate-binding protein [Rhizobacter sp.]|nr:folate-binding protein [Rhizobacter sp.]